MEELLLLNYGVGVSWTVESPLDCKEIEPVNPKANQSWTFIGRTDAEVEAPILWTPDVKRWLFGKDPGKDWRQEEKRAMENKMIGWHHQLNGHEFEQTSGDSKDREAWCAAVHGVIKSQTWLSNRRTTTTTTCLGHRLETQSQVGLALQVSWIWTA